MKANSNTVRAARGRPHPWWSITAVLALTAAILVPSLTAPAGHASGAATSTTTATTAAPYAGLQNGACPDYSKNSHSCFTLVGYSYGDPVGVDDPSDLNSRLVQVGTGIAGPSGTSIPPMRWELLYDGEGKIRLHGLSVDRCLDVGSNHLALLQQCDLTRELSEFFIRGVDSTAGVYRLVSAKTASQCITQTNAGLELQACDRASDKQKWVFSGSLVRNGSTWLPGSNDWVESVAGKLAGQECVKDKTCKWIPSPGTDYTTNQPAAQTDSECTGPVLYNWGGPMGQESSLSYAVSQSDEDANTIGGGGSVVGAIKTDIGLPIIGRAKLSAQLTVAALYRYSWAAKKESTEESIIPSVDPGHWAWFSRETYSRTLHGTLKFAYGSETEFSLAETDVEVPSAVPGSTDATDVVLVEHTSVNPPDADCTSPVLNEKLITSEASGAGVQAGTTAPVGMIFTTGAKRMEVSQLGRMRMLDCSGTISNGADNTVRLSLVHVQANGGLDRVPGAITTVNVRTVSGGKYAFGRLPKPVILNPNSKYYLLSDEKERGPCWPKVHVAEINTALLGITEVGYVKMADGVAQETILKDHMVDQLNLIASE